MIERKPRVLNKYIDDCSGGVNIMRPSKWGNHYSHQSNAWIDPSCRCTTREEAIAAYERWLMANPVMIAEAKVELKGRDLICCCSPRPCHGNVLIRVANED